MENELVLFKDGEITPEKETVWLTQEQMSELFDTARSSIAYHIGNIFNIIKQEFPLLLGGGMNCISPVGRKVSQ